MAITPKLENNLSMLKEFRLDSLGREYNKKVTLEVILQLIHNLQTPLAI